MSPFDISAPLPGAPGDVAGQLVPTTTLLEASAGTGKTWTIAALVTRYVADGLATIDQILAVTFTNAATSELRERVRSRLDEVAGLLDRAVDGVAPDDPDDLVRVVLDGSPAALALRRRRLRAALTSFDTATILTIHQFCHLVLKGLGVAGDTDPRAQLVEDLSDLRKEVVDDLWLRDHATSGLLTHADAATIAAAVVNNPGARIEPADAAPGSVDEARAGFAQAVVREFDLRKRRLGVLSYDDLLVQLRDALADPQSVAATRMRARWPIVLIDEFQDTDPVQWEVFERAFHGGCVLVLIGDPKQAIYAFRGGDVFTYLRAAALTDDRQTLVVNQRSDPELVASVHTVLGGAQLGDPEITVHPIDAARTDDHLRGLPGRAFQLRTLLRSDLGAPDDKLAAVGTINPRVAEDAAAQVRAMLGGGPQVGGVASGDSDRSGKAGARRHAGSHVERPQRSQIGADSSRSGRGPEAHRPSAGAEICDPRTGEWRPLGAGDIAVLAHSRRHLEFVQDALREVGVPAVITGGQSVFATEAGRAWRALLEAMSQPHRAGLVRAAGTTSFFGLTANELDAGGDALTDHLSDRLREQVARFHEGGIAAVFEAFVAEPESTGGRRGEPHPGGAMPRRRSDDVPGRTSSDANAGSVPPGGGAVGGHRWIQAQPESTGGRRGEPHPGGAMARRRSDDVLGRPSSDANAANGPAGGRAVGGHRWIQAQGLSARVLGTVGGERHLTDLRHLAELMHAAVARERLGLAGLVAWFLDRQRETNDTTSERTRRIDSDDAAVQLVTIHGSKGLEYPIVLAPYLSDRFTGREKPTVLTYHDDDRQRVVDVGDPAGRPGALLDRHAAEDAGESLRLLYVACTRARSRLIAWWSAGNNAPDAALTRMMLGRGPGGAEVPVRQAPQPDGPLTRWFQRWDEVGGPAWATAIPVDAPPPPTAPPPAPLAARTFDRDVDQQWRRTSYSALAAVAEADPGRVASEPEVTPRDDEPTIVLGASPESASPAGDAPGLDLPSPLAGFPVGARFGSLVHAVLEHADPSAADWRAELLQHCREQLVEWPVDLDAEALADALIAVCDSPLGPLAGDTTLRGTPIADRLRELDFELPIGGGDAAVPDPRLLGDMAGLLRRHLPDDDPLRAYADALDDPVLGEQVLVGYLTGSVDVVLRVQGADGETRYLICDYKTNWLGDADLPLTAASYTPDRLAAAMGHSSYPLQALLYAVVLHRFLRWRLPDYDPERHLGGVLYLYLRGMCGPETPSIDGHPCGVFSWRPPAALVTELSDLLDGADGDEGDRP